MRLVCFWELATNFSMTERGWEAEWWVLPSGMEGTEHSWSQPHLHGTQSAIPGALVCLFGDMLS